MIPSASFTCRSLDIVWIGTRQIQLPAAHRVSLALHLVRTFITSSLVTALDPVVPVLWATAIELFITCSLRSGCVHREHMTVRGDLEKARPTLIHGFLSLATSNITFPS